jgi:hypothetical protein
MLELEKNAKQEKDWNIVPWKQEGSIFSKCTKILVTQSPFHTPFLYYFLVFIHHQHGHNVIHIDVSKYKIGIYYHISKYDKFSFINMYGNQNIG